MFGLFGNLFRKKNNTAQQNQQELESLKAQQLSADVFLIIYTEFFRLLLRHIKTLITKYEQAIYRDDYGTIELDKARREIDYFIEKTLTNGLYAADLPSHILREDYIRLLLVFFNNQEIEDRDMAVSLIEDFLNVIDDDDLVDVVSNIASRYTCYLMASKDYSNETLFLLFGNDYQSFLDSVRTAFGNSEIIQLGTVMCHLIDLRDLSNLQKWFQDRHKNPMPLENVLTGEEFEVFCKKRIEELGWRVRTTKASGDFGADLVIERDGQTIIIQCKYYSQPIGVKAVQEAFSAMTFYNANKSAVVSNQTYTQAARQMAERNKVLLLHVNDLDALT